MKKKVRKNWNKKADTVVFEATIFIVLNIIFIALLLIFVYSSGKEAFIYEQIYAKQIALLIDNAEPNMIIGLDMQDAVKIAEKNKIAKEKIVFMNKEENKVIVSLSGRGGHSFQYFSDYDIETKIVQDNLEIIIKEKK